MNTRRDQILKHLPGTAPLHIPQWTYPSLKIEELADHFQRISRKVGSQCEKYRDVNELGSYLNTTYSGLNCFSALSGVFGQLTLEEVTRGQAELVILAAKWGVAENGAVWLDDTVLPHRILPFYTEHLVVTLSVQHLLPDMHAAYKNVKIDASGFGIWVSGPSKTADIEQALVVGAQGPKSFLIALLP